MGDLPIFKAATIYPHASKSFARAAFGAISLISAIIKQSTDERVCHAYTALGDYGGSRIDADALSAQYDKCRAALRDAEIDHQYSVSELTTTPDERKKQKRIAYAVTSAIEYALGPQVAPSWVHVVPEQNYQVWKELSRIVKKLRKHTV